MISVYFNETGYHLRGDTIEVARSCPPALTESGSTVLPPLHHLYAVLYYALQELEGGDSQEDAMIYGNSRLIEEINGVTDPIDDIADQWCKHIRRTLIPIIKGCVTFRKKASELVNRKVAEGIDNMIGNVDIDARNAAMAALAEKIKDQTTRNTTTRLNKFKRNWNGK